jgi:asparagine synthase (glutamine-hydrolysing)
MCGIIGVFNNKDAVKIVKNGLKVMENRGKDASDIMKFNNACIGHNLHAIIDVIKQPIKEDETYIVANCEIYNWEELDKKYNLKSKNDAHLLLKLLNKKGTKALDEVDGVYAFCYYDGKKAILARDILGVKPIWFSFSNFFAFASEKKALLKNNIYDAIELNPRKIIEYDLKDNKLKYQERDFFKILPENKKSLEKIKQDVTILINNAIKKRITDKKVGVLFSGGIDSLMIAYILKSRKISFTCYTAALEEKGLSEAEDLIYAIKAAKKFNFKLKIRKINLKQTEQYIKKIIPLIESTNVVKVGVALPFYLAAEQAKKDKVKVLFSGLGSEEIFAGYERHEKSSNINKECLSGLRKIYERDLYRDDVVTMANTIELRLPFLDKSLVDYALKIPEKYKLNKDNKKLILRYIADDLRIPKEFAWRKKKAAQYGSKFDRAILKLAKVNGFKYKADYLNSLSKEYNLNLGIMLSSGKDSCYAAYLMKKHNYNLKCALTIKSQEKYSFMFHTPNIDIASLQSQAMEIPILIRETKGKKEDELKDLKKLLLEAKEKYNIDGIITGALFSSYQRERFEKVADNLGLKVFSPLWHKDQEEEMRELIDENFKIIFSSVAAEGLNEKWVGKIITHKDIDKLVELNNKIGLNIAGEGGEFESLVLDCPLFKKEIKIVKSKIVKESETNTFFVIEKAKLKSKQ